MNKQKNNTKGITLIALVITIVLLVILVGVTVSTVINTGLISNTKQASTRYIYQEAKEQMLLANIDVEIEINKRSASDKNYNAVEDMDNLKEIVEKSLTGEKWSVGYSENVITMTYEDKAIVKEGNADGTPTQEGWVSGTITIENNGTKFAFDEETMQKADEIGKPVLSDKGVYFEQPYIGEYDGASAMLILYEDGTAEVLANLSPYATDTATYGEDNTITFATFGPATVSNEGKQIYIAAQNVTLTLQTFEDDEEVEVREMTDSKGNEWVWIEVPKSIYPEGTEENDYEAIENAMIDYVSAYREEGYEDKYYEGCGFESEEEYNSHKQSMLSSVFTNGGFWVGKYEAGTRTARYSSDDQLTEIVVKQNMYPYNYVTVAQAQELAESLTIEGKTASLMFGVQWDLMLKYMEESVSSVSSVSYTTPLGAEIRVGITQEMMQNVLTSNSTLFGNYYNATFKLNRGQYTISLGSKESWNNFDVATSGYVDGKIKQASSYVLLTTGAVNRNRVLNIYDFAGNTWEWTLERSSDANKPLTYRGGDYITSGDPFTAVYRGSHEPQQRRYPLFFPPSFMVGLNSVKTKTIMM